jgi:hypothetical protein
MSAVASEGAGRIWGDFSTCALEVVVEGEEDGQFLLVGEGSFVGEDSTGNLR